MAAPGTTVLRRESSPPRSAPTDSSVWFIAGMTEKGPTTATLIRSMAEYADTFGARVSYGFLYDALDVFFREGGSRAYLARVQGPTPVIASAKLYDVAGSLVGDVSLNAVATSAGDWANSLNVEVIAPITSGFRIKVTHDVDGTLETSPDLATPAAAVTWSAASRYIRLTLGVSNENPRIQGPTSFTGGTDDHANATNTQWAAALAAFPVDLGPGQVSMPGRTTNQAHLDTLAHASSRNRVAILDAPDTADVPTLVSLASSDRSSDARYGGLFAPWAIVPGIASGTTRTVPYSAVQAGIAARNDSAGESPNRPAAGELGQAQYATDLSQAAWVEADRASLNDAGVNIARVRYGGVRTYGYRTLANPSTEGNYLLLSNARLLMEIQAQANVIGERYVFGEIDGQQHSLSEFGGDLRAMLLPWWQGGSLFGPTAEEAFAVDVGPQVNTPQTLAALELHAVIQVVPSGYGEVVTIEIVKRGITEGVN